MYSFNTNSSDSSVIPSALTGGLQIIMFRGRKGWEVRLRPSVYRKRTYSKLIHSPSALCLRMVLCDLFWCVKAERVSSEVLVCVKMGDL